MDKRAFFYNFVFMFISPALSLIHGLKSNYSPRFKRLLTILFITIYGSIITLSEGHDGARHLQNVYDSYVDLSFVDFLSGIMDMLLFIDNPNFNDDPYIHFISYLTGGILGMPALFFIVVSFVYAYFFAGSIFRLIELRKEIHYKWIVYFFILLFILWKNIEGINTVRTWTGLWVLFYGSLSYYKTRKRKYLLLMLVPPLIHIGYFMMAIPAWVVLLVGVRHNLFIVLFIASFTTVLLNPQVVVTQLEKTEVGEAKVRGYYVEEKATLDELAEVYSANTWYKRYYELGFQNIGLILVIFAFIALGIYKFNMNSVEAHLFSIGILTKALSNVTWFLYSVSSRSEIVSAVFILGAVVLFLIRSNEQKLYYKRYKILEKILRVSSVFFIPYVVYKVADMIAFISVYMLAFPFIPWVSDEVNYSIREFLGVFI